MRDNHEGQPEILDAFQQDEHYFGLVQLERSGEQRTFRFGVSRDGYLALKRALQLRLFDQMPGVRCRYFFVPAVRRLEGERVMMTVRVEQGRDGKQIEIEASRDVVANLMWFYELDDWSRAEHLAVVA
jgi:hypothetical protein